jgi:phosphoketolase
VIAGKHPVPQWLAMDTAVKHCAGTITTPFDMTVLNDLDRFHLVMDTIDRLQQTGDKGIYLK